MFNIPNYDIACKACGKFHCVCSTYMVDDALDLSIVLHEGCKRLNACVVDPSDCWPFVYALDAEHSYTYWK